MTEVLGRAVLVQSAGVFDKDPGDGKYVAWHQDGHYWHLDRPPRLVSAWIALRCPALNRAVAFGWFRAPHHSHLPHRGQPADGHMLVSGLTLDQDMESPQPGGRRLACGPGRCRLPTTHERLVHSLEPNRGRRGSRIGFAIRYLTSQT